MAVIEIFRLLGSIFVETDPANRAIDKTEKKAKGLSSTLAGGVKAAAKWTAGLGGAVGGLVLLANTTARSADQIDKMALRTGLSRTRLQELQFATSQAGVSFEALQGAAARVTGAMGRADDEGKAASAVFQRLGIAVHDSAGKLRDSGAVFNEALLALAGMENQTERNVLAQQLFGRGALELVPLLDAGTQGIAGLSARAHELGLVMTDQAIAAGVKMGDTLDELSRSTGALKNEAMLAIIPVITDVAAWLTRLVVAFRALDPEQQRLVVTIGAVVLAGGPLVKLFTGLKNLVTGLGAVVTGVFTLAASPVGLAVLALGALVAAGIALHRNWDEIRAWAAEVWLHISSTVRGAVDGITGWIDGLIASVGRAIDWVRNLLGLNREAAITPPAAPRRGAPAPAPAEAPVMGLQHGGIVTRPTLALVGERAPEAVLPLAPLQAGTARIEALLQAILAAVKAEPEPVPQLAGILAGATIQVRNDQDIERLSRELYRLHAARARAAGVVT